MTCLPLSAETSSKLEVLLRAEALVVGYGTPLLPPIAVDIAAHQMWGIVGRNGSGKTTLLQTLLGLLPARQGRVQRDAALRISYIAQRLSLQDHVPARVLDIVSDGDDRNWSFLRPRVRARRDARVRSALQQVGAETLWRAAFSELSEGQKQRVLLARALISEPNVLVLDEPTSAMDMMGERTILRLLADTCAVRPVAVLVVGHHVAALAACATHLMVVDAEAALAICGPRKTVADDVGVRNLYGNLFGREAP